MAKVVVDKKKKQIYLGDSLLKAPGVKMEWTQDDIDEFNRCRDDVIYFIETYMKIVHIDHGVVPFMLYDYQKKVIELYKESRFITLKFPRQSGKCFDFFTCINIRNKYNGETRKITIGEFYEMQKRKQNKKRQKEM